jgi:maleylacetoacetate isomerase
MAGAFCYVREIAMSLNPILFDYWRSSASYRVRIALNLKSVTFESVSVNLRSGEQQSEEYRRHNPQALVPMLQIGEERIAQSLAIIDYLDARFPDPPLLPREASERAHVLSLALTIACDVHPLNNLRVLNYLKNELGQGEEARNAWYVHWVTEGLRAVEATAAPSAGRYLFGDEPTLADVCLVPQLYNARRFDVPLDEFPLLTRVEAEAGKLEAFNAAHPDRVAPQD